MIIAPSILAADFSILRDQIQIVEEAGADWLHLDIMDGHFVPNISFGPSLVETVRKIAKCPLDVHLMIENVDHYIPQFRDAGADMITVHVEVTHHLNRSVALINEKGAKAGVALNPATPISFIQNIIEDVNLVLAMSVNPGFGGQSFIPSVLSKISAISSLIEKSERSIYLEVDGGVDLKTTPQIAKAGGNVLVAGSAVFGASDIGQAVKDIKQLALQNINA